MNMIKHEQMSLYEAHLKEQSILNCINQKYKPLKRISGLTECFSIDKKDIICKMI